MKPLFMSSILRLCVTSLAWAALALSPGHAGAAEQRSQGTARVFSENPRVLIETTQGDIEIELLLILVLLEFLSLILLNLNTH